MAETFYSLHDEDLAASVCWHLLESGPDKARIDEVTANGGSWTIRFRYWDEAVNSDVDDMVREWCEENAEEAREQIRSGYSESESSRIESDLKASTYALAALKAMSSCPASWVPVYQDMYFDAVNSLEYVSPVTHEWAEMLMNGYLEEGR